MLKKEKEYLKNTVILLIGKFSSQFISFLLLPIYTYKLAAEDYGYIDLVQTYISLLVPILVLQLDSAIFRFLIDVREKKKEEDKIISSSIVCLISFAIVFTIIFFIISKFLNIKFIKIIIINMIAIMFNTCFIAILRGKGKNLEYSIASVITAVLILISNITLINLWKFGAESILIASTIGNIGSMIFVIKKEKIYKSIRRTNFSKNILKQLLKYSVPMIPNVVSWWIVGLSDRTLITIFIGVAENGIYSVACKFSNLLNNVFSIFSMSWQETVSIHINDQDASEFFSKMIMQIYEFFIAISCVLIGILPIAFDVLIGNDYKCAYNYIPILLFGNILNILSGLFGGIYVAKKLTKKVATTTIFSAILNIIINILFIKKIGLYAAVLSTVISYLILSIYRYFDVKKILCIKLNYRKMIVSIIVFIIVSTVYYIRNYIICILITFLICILYLGKNYKYCKKILVKIKSILNK